MDILFIFILSSTLIFFIAMFLGYRDAMRVSAPKGALASMLNKFKMWNYTDESGQAKGIVWRQSVVIKIILSLAFAMLVRFTMYFIIPAEAIDITGGYLTGITAWLLQSAVIFLGLVLAYLWPKVRSKAKEVSQDTFKGKHRESKGADAKTKEEPKQVEKAAPEQKKDEQKEEQKKDEPKKDSPDDIINDYLS